MQGVIFSSIHMQDRGCGRNWRIKPQSCYTHLFSPPGSLGRNIGWLDAVIVISSPIIYPDFFSPSRARCVLTHVTLQETPKTEGRDAKCKGGKFHTHIYHTPL